MAHTTPDPAPATEPEPAPSPAPAAPGSVPGAADDAPGGSYTPLSQREPRAFDRTGAFATRVRRTPTAEVPVPRLPPGPVLRYAVAVGGTLLAFAPTMALGRLMQPALFTFFWPAVLGAAWYGGRGPAVVASVLSVTLVNYFLIPPYAIFNFSGPENVVPLLLFLAVSLLVSSLTHSLQGARMQAVWAATTNADLAMELDRQAEELEQQLEEAQALSEELEHTTDLLAERTASAEMAEEFSRGILSSITDPFVVQDAEWRFRYVNEPAAEIFRRTHADDVRDLIGRVVWEAYPEIVGTAFEREMRRSARERVPVAFEAFNPASAEWSVLSCYPLPDGGLATQWKDITARKRAEEAAHHLARASEALAESLDHEAALGALARLLVPALGDWCTVHLPGDDGRLRAVAVAHVDPAKAAWALELDRRFPPEPDAPHGASHVLRTGQPSLLTDLTDEVLAVATSGPEHLALLQAVGLRSAVLVPMVAHDRVLGVLSLFASESGRRYGEADLQLATELARRAALAVDNARLHRTALEARHAAEAAEAQLARVFAQAPVAIAVLRGPTHVYQIANARYLALVGRASVTGLPVREAVPELEAQGLVALMDQVLATGTPHVADETPVALRRADGSGTEDAFFNLVLQPLVDADGATDGVAIVAADVTQQVRAREAAHEANLAKSQFLTVMSHELRTPLNAIAGYTELLRLGIRGPVTPEQDADLERIARSQRSLLSLINDVLNYAKLEAGHVRFETATVSMHDFLRGLEALVLPQLRARSLAYRYDGCDAGLAVRADAEKMQQIVVNLLSNAVKFTEPGGQIGVTCGADDALAYVRVHDTGEGIPADKLGAIFEPFVQLDRKLTSAHEGTGLGLAISRDLARAMGGDLRVESTVGVGSTFTLVLPKA